MHHPSFSSANIMRRFIPTRSSASTRETFYNRSRQSLAPEGNNTETGESGIELSWIGTRVVNVPSPLPSPRPDNEQWSKDYQFILAALGYTVGLGNLWRFPYMMYKHGGMVFLVPYFLVLMFIGIPTFFMELVLGQYVNSGPIMIFGRLAPAFKGLGYSMVAMISCVIVHYNMINCWSIFYFFSAFQSEIPWNSTEKSEEYFIKTVLHFDNNPTWNDFGDVQWQLILCSLATWMIVFLVIWRGITQSRVIVAFTCLYPFLCLLILCIIGLAQPGSFTKSLEFFWKFDIDEFMEPKVCFAFLNVHD